MLVLLTGPSGTGKSTIEKRLVEHGFTALKSHTTRAMRSGIENGSEYHFVSVDEFNATEMVERVEYRGNFYGLSKAEVDQTNDDGKLFTAVVEGNGIIHLLKVTTCKTLIVFVDAPDEALEKRLAKRGPDGLKRLEGIESERRLRKISDVSVWNDDGNLDEIVESLVRITGNVQLNVAPGLSDNQVLN